MQTTVNAYTLHIQFYDLLHTYRKQYRFISRTPKATQLHSYPKSPLPNLQNGHGFSCVHYKSKKMGLTVMPKH